jgi:hypothetical protein
MPIRQAATAADQLAVEAVHDDRQRRQEDHHLLHGGEDAVVEQAADVCVARCRAKGRAHVQNG